MPTIFRLAPLLFFLAALALPPAASADETLSQNKDLTQEKDPEKNDSIFNMIFGTPPDMPTERGLLLINAFHDLNADNKKDDTEPELRNEITCTVDGIQYRIPAFIPGLMLHENYKVECFTDNASGSFAPESDVTELFIQHKGQVFFVEIPCRQLDKEVKPSS